MMNTENPQNPDDLRKELEEENELLLTQLHLVQEELERYYLKCKELEQGSVSSAPHVNTALTAWVDDELPQALAETMRQKKLSEIQRELQQIEASNALPARLGNLLIQSADAGALASLPGKLLKIWRQSKQQAPDVLGGKEYKKVIETYEKEGFAATEKLLVTADVFATHKANAWTALARHLKGCNKAHVVLAARRAYAEDPKAYRLKWLAFRLRDNREYLEADALLDLLPADITFNDSESRLVSEIRYEAKTDRLRQAKKGSSYDARREAQNNQQKQLSNERDEQSRLAAERAREIETLLKKTKAQHAAAQQQLVERDSQLVAQQEALNRLEQDKTQLAAQHAAAQQQLVECDSQLVAQQEALNRLEQDKTQLAAQHAAAQQQLVERDSQLVAQQEALNRLEQDKTQLAAQHAAAQQQLVECDSQLVAQQEALNRLEQDKTQLAAQHAAAQQQLVECDSQLVAQQEALNRLEQDKTQLAAQHAAAQQQLVERDSQLAAQQEALNRLDQDKTQLVAQRNTTQQLAAARLTEINELQQHIKKHQAEVADLSARQQLMHEEMVRAEAQLDLIKDVMLRESAL